MVLSYICSNAVGVRHQRQPTNAQTGDQFFCGNERMLTVVEGYTDEVNNAIRKGLIHSIHIFKI